MLRLHRPFLVLSLVVAWGCSGGSGEGEAGGAAGASDVGSGSGGGGGAGAGTAACEVSLSDCLSRQEACVVTDEGERCEPCDLGQYADATGRCMPLGGDALVNDFGEFELTAGEERSDVCQSWTLGNETGLWVNAVELVNDGGYHHSNWLFTPDTMYEGPDGAWSCDERGYGELEAAVAGGVLYAQSTQALHEVQKFPDGVALYVPPHARVIGGTHMLNVSTSTLATDLELRIYTIPSDQVQVPLAPFRFSYYDLTIPPLSQSAFTGECDMASANPTPTPDGTLDMDLYYVLPHYHALGSSFRLEAFGGPRDGEVIYEIGGFTGEARGRAFDPPFSLAGAQGVRVTCGFDNPRSEEVGWGIGDQEMCVMLGFARSDFIYDDSVNSGASVGTVDGVPSFSGECAVLGLEFERGKGGL
jgi:hypothetical protein